jgi:5'-methylthioadenosine phosphorylase
MNLVTDYDVWYAEHDEVTVEMVIANMQANLETAKQILTHALPAMETLDDGCSCGSALAGAILTDPARISQEAKDQLRLLIEKYVSC